MLYRNEPSVIIGKHQNAFAEVNHLFVKQHQIPVIRRLSGGGTVYHDMGNINFTFIHNGREGHLVDFKKFITPMCTVLMNLGVPAALNSRNDMVINGLKISGNAEHVFKNRTLHHGTLLYSANLDNLRESLKVQPQQYVDRAVRSVPSAVTNINHSMRSVLSVEEFMKTIQESLLKDHTDACIYNFNVTDLSQIHRLIETKYNTWQWNYGYSPKCKINKSGMIYSTSVQCALDIEKGIIAGIKIQPEVDYMLEIMKALLYSEYNQEVLAKKLSFLGSEALESWMNLIFY
jgi:lipoate-protein ligase A